MSFYDSLIQDLKWWGLSEGSRTRSKGTMRSIWRWELWLKHVYPCAFLSPSWFGQYLWRNNHASFQWFSWEQFDSFLFISALKTLESFCGKIALQFLDVHLKPLKDKRICMFNSKSLRPPGILVFNIMKPLIFGVVLPLTKHYFYF